MNILRIFIYTIALIATKNENELNLRWDISEGIANVTESIEEQNYLAKIAQYESGYRADISSCKVVGKLGEVGVFQVMARTTTERKAICSSHAESARSALLRIRESITSCKHLSRVDRLSMYTTGKCKSNERYSRLRTPAL